MPEVEFNVTEKRVIGLRLNNGTEVWPPNTWHGRPIDTAEDRQVILDALKVSSENLGLHDAQLYGHFKWLVRIDRTYTTTVTGESEEWPIDSGQFFAPLQQVSAVDAEEATEESDGPLWVGAGPDPRHAVDTDL